MYKNITIIKNTIRRKKGKERKNDDKQFLLEKNLGRYGVDAWKSWPRQRRAAFSFHKPLSVLRPGHICSLDSRMIRKRGDDHRSILTN